MALDKDLATKVLAQIDRDELAQLGADFTSIPSPTGQEKAAGDRHGVVYYRARISMQKPAAKRFGQPYSKILCHSINKLPSSDPVLTRIPSPRASPRSPSVSPPRRACQTHVPFERPEHPRDHLLDGEAWSGLLNVPILARIELCKLN